MSFWLFHVFSQYIFFYVINLFYSLWVPPTVFISYLSFPLILFLIMVLFKSFQMLFKAHLI